MVFLPARHEAIPLTTGVPSLLCSGLRTVAALRFIEGDRQRAYSRGSHVALIPTSTILRTILACSRGSVYLLPCPCGSNAAKQGEPLLNQRRRSDQARSSSLIKEKDGMIKHNVWWDEHRCSSGRHIYAPPWIDWEHSDWLGKRWRMDPTVTGCARWAHRSAQYRDVRSYASNPHSVACSSLEQ